MLAMAGVVICPADVKPSILQREYRLAFSPFSVVWTISAAFYAQALQLRAGSAEPEWRTPASRQISAFRFGFLDLVKTERIAGVCGAAVL